MGQNEDIKYDCIKKVSKQEELAVMNETRV
jgi:hypothetical protein